MNKIEEILNKKRITLEDFKTLGIVGVSNENILYVNSNLKNKKYTTKKQVQDVVNMVNETYKEIIKVRTILKKIEKGTVTIDDYDYIGVENINSENVEEIQKYLG